MKKQLVKNGRKIKGFVWQDEYGKWWYAYGRPSQESYMSIGCRDLEHGIANIEMPMFNR